MQTYFILLFSILQFCVVISNAFAIYEVYLSISKKGTLFKMCVLKWGNLYSFLTNNQYVCIQLKSFF